MIIDRLWKILTDGKAHSEESLCTRLEITRAELAAWRDRLPEAAFDFLKIENGIWQAVFPALEIETAQLAAFAAAEEIDFAVQEDDSLLISQMVQYAQTAENIHRTVWAATANQNRKTLAFALAWVTPRPNARLLSLAATLSLAKVLRRFGIGAQIVWPREIIADGQKIGKITVEESPLENGRLTVIHAAADFFVPPEENGIGLWQLLPDISPPALLKSAVHEIVRDTQYFFMRGLWPFQDNYNGMLAQRGHNVQLRQPQAAPAQGRLLGIDMDGHLMLDTEGQVFRFENGTLGFRQPETVYTLPAVCAQQMLLLDAGNSQIKWAWIINGTIAGVFRAPYGKLFPLAEFCRRHPSIESVCGSAVCGEIKKSQVAAQIPRRIQWLHSERTACGIRNHYHNINEHGADRWFNVLGARKFTQNACVIVSCGTAVTVDALTDSNQYLGGSILPGLNLMKESLAEHTANLDRPFGKIYPFSTTTPNAIASGIMDAVIGAVVLMVHRLKQRCENRTVDIIITGGGAPRIRHHFPEELLVDTQVQIVDNLVIYGLLQRLGQS